MDFRPELSDHRDGGDAAPNLSRHPVPMNVHAKLIAYGQKVTATLAWQ
jgi:hypothetical protein